MLKKHYVICRIVAQSRNRISFLICGAGNIYYVDKHISLVQVIKKLVAHAFSFMRSWNQSSYIKQLNRNKSLGIYAVAKPRIAFDIELLVCAFHPYIACAVIRLNCSERIACDFNICKGMSLEKGAFSGAWLSNYTYEHFGWYPTLC